MGVVSYWFQRGWCLSSINPYRSYADVTQGMCYVSVSLQPITGKSLPQLPGGWSSALRLEDWALITLKSCSQDCYKHRSSKHQRDQYSRCCGAVIDAGTTENKSQLRDGGYGISPWMLAWLVPQGSRVGWEQLHALCPGQTHQILAEHFRQCYDPLGVEHGGSYPRGSWLLAHLHKERELTLAVWSRDSGLPCPLPRNPLRV